MIEPPSGGGKFGLPVSPPLPSLADELKQMKQAGLPTTPEALQAPLPPEGRNAAPIYRQLVALLKSKPFADDDKVAYDIVRRGTLTAEQASKLRELLARRPDVGRLVHQAVERPECVFDRPWRQGASMKFPEFATMRTAARWLTAESALQLYDGKPLDAVKTQALGFQIANHAAKDPMLVAYLVAVAIDGITLHGMERILYAARDKPEVVRSVQMAITSGWKRHSLAHGLHGEVILPIVELDRYRAISPEAYEQSIRREIGQVSGMEIPPLGPEDKKHWSAFVDRSEVALLVNMSRLMEAADKPYSVAGPAFRAIEAGIESHRQDPAYVNARIVFPDYNRSVTVRAAAAARAAIVQSAAAVLNWKLQHGSFPDNLQAAMPQVPVDPFDGRTIRYRREGTGFVIYSTGPAGKFSGGNLATQPDKDESLFRYPLPATKKRK